MGPPRHPGSLCPLGSPWYMASPWHLEPRGTQDPHVVQHCCVTWDPFSTQYPPVSPGTFLAPGLPDGTHRPHVSGTPVVPGSPGTTVTPGAPMAPSPPRDPLCTPMAPSTQSPNGTRWDGGVGQREFQSQPPPLIWGLPPPWLLLHPTALLCCRGGCVAAWGLHSCMGEVVPLYVGEGLRASTWGAALPHGGLHSPVGAALHHACTAPLCCSRCLWCRETLGGS